MDELFAAFPPATPQRQALHGALAYCVATVARLRLAEQIAIDGSYITAKADPEDVDIAVLTPGIYQLAGEQHLASEGIDMVLLDIQFAHDAADFQGWLTFFATARNLIRKGVVLLVYLDVISRGGGR